MPFVFGPGFRAVAATDAANIRPPYRNPARIPVGWETGGNQAADFTYPSRVLKSSSALQTD